MEERRAVGVEKQIDIAILYVVNRYAPPIADFISRHEMARFAVRAALTPAVYAIQYPMTALFLLVALVGGSTALRKRRTVDRSY